MAMFVTNSPTTCALAVAVAVAATPPLLKNNKKKPSLLRFSISSSSRTLNNSSNTRVCACLFNPSQEPILKEAFKEPVAFLGGMFAGLLRLDLNDDPLKEWLTKTVEASGIADDEDIINNDEQSNSEEVPEEIEIE